MAAAGHQAEAARKDAMKANKGKYVLVVEGAIPTKRQRHLLQDRRPDRDRHAQGMRGRRGGGDRHRFLRLLGRHAFDDFAAGRFQPDRFGWVSPRYSASRW